MLKRYSDAIIAVLVLLVLVLFVRQEVQNKHNEVKRDIEETVSANNEFVSYDEQIKLIFKSAAEGHGQYTVISNPTEQNLPDFAERKAVISTIYQKLTHNEMLLKNVVFRKDSNVIRTTYADRSNDYVFKVAYKTDHDPALVNSIYADKTQIIDIKIMHKKGNDYEYMLLENQLQHQIQAYHRVKREAEEKIKQGQVGIALPMIPEQSVTSGLYVLSMTQGNERCGYCHIVAKNDSANNSGLFFSRYQETSKEKQKEFGAESIFREQDFIKETKDALANLNLPSDMVNEFLFSTVADNEPQKISRYARTLFEMPELVEVLAKDNQQSYCININFGKDEKVLSSENYVCADYQNKKLYVRYQNELLTTQKDEVSFVRPFY